MKTNSIVLIVDDEPKGREVLEDLLMPQGYELAFASDGAEALAKAAEIMPDPMLEPVSEADLPTFLRRTFPSR